MSGKRKPDYSNYLAHFTSNNICVNNDNSLNNDYKTMSAKDKLISILKSKTIYKSTMPWTDIDAVCFTECPWNSLIEHSKNYSPYGLGFSKKFIFGRHGAPVMYMRVDAFIEERKSEFNHFRDDLKFLVTPFQPIYTPSRIKRLHEKPVDYTHEREWRIPTDLNFEYKDVVFVVVKSNEDFASFPMDLRDAIGEDKFLVMDSYKMIEHLWPLHII